MTNIPLIGIFCAENQNSTHSLASHHQTVGSLNSAGSLDGDRARGTAGSTGRLGLHLLDDVLALNNLTEDDVLAIEMGGRDELVTQVSGVIRL